MTDTESRSIQLMQHVKTLSEQARRAFSKQEETKDFRRFVQHCILLSYTDVIYKPCDWESDELEPIDMDKFYDIFPDLDYDHCVHKCNITCRMYDLCDIVAKLKLPASFALTAMTICYTHLKIHESLEWLFDYVGTARTDPYYQGKPIDLKDFAIKHVI
jgi:hypothetical protein